MEVTSVLLEQISSPQDIRRMDPAQLAQLAEEIRAFVVDAVNASPSGGHLGSNLGVVELTLALHRSFHSPHDVILWDTGHQAYVHKLLTGRREGFSTLRQAGGMSGYPSRAESEHDWIENSHASTVLSYAQGMATALELSGGPKRHVVAVVGDGAMTGGMAFEGLNNLGHSGRRVITILNDNGRSYAPTASRLGDSLVKLRAHPMYRRNTARIERVVRDLPGGEVLGRGWDSATHALRDMFEPPAFFEDLGVAYLGPLDGHDIDALERALAAAKEMDGPVVVHVLTQKGRGYAPAENDSVKHLHDMGSVKPGSYTGAFSEAIVAEAEARPELVALTAAMPDSTGLLPMMERFPDRVFDVGIAEQHAVTSAAGMAMMGLRPVFAVYSTFLTRAIDQVNLDVGLHHQPVLFCLDRAGVTGNDGASHHGVLDMVLLTKVPDMVVFAPSSYQELPQMMTDALDLCDGPAAIRWTKSAAPQVPPDQVGSGLSARCARADEDAEVCLIGVGRMLAAAQGAAERLEAEGVACTVWDPRVVKPLDAEMLADAARHRLVVTIEDGVREGGVGSAIADSLRDLAPVGGPDVRVLGVPVAYLPHGEVDAILADLGLDSAGVVAEVNAWRSAKASQTS
ncbi:MAG: 1-deoxy-D-xylulose-5-phosphate synthase [Candidatus Microthrix sp.]|nr:1-deoxy-D-xylulose-5-phosphate synthase [Candidatus Microthrix sp.]MBK6437360.1 1-deoxy-D-xylulose-5-phosphate synthase [Candidatus Microthrix sp.]MBK6969793.1 1-deoxy-D-xylulose-5-phosphate synthase [Candidatus Microthrix sp.]MBK7165822.1 1-deoxy-D-xylulose-5-phosphate synthase [Candidatus Microthrix sp.]